MTKKDLIEVRRKELQTQLKSAYRRKDKLDEKIERLLDRLYLLRQEETERDRAD